MIEIADQMCVSGEVHLTVVRGDVTEIEIAQILSGRLSRGMRRRIVSREVIRNIVTNTGRAGIATLMGSGTTRPTYFAVGTNVIVPAVADTTLSGELTRKALSVSTSISTYYARYGVTFTTTDFNNTVRGVALFTAAAAGDMWCEASTNTTKNGSQALVCDWRVQILT